MAYIEKLFAPGARFSARKAKRTVVATLVASILVALSLGTATASGASSVGATRAEVVALQARITGGAGLIHQLTERYADASLQASSLEQQLHSQYAQLGTLRRDLGHSESTLRQAAVRSYTGDAATSSQTVGRTTDPAIGDEYLSVASGDVGNTIDTFRLRQRQVATAIRTISAEQQANRRDLEAAASARRSALSQADADQQRLSVLQVQLASAERAATAASTAAAARATAATQGLPVNGGLVKLTESETSPAAPTSAPVPPAPPTSTAPVTPPTTTPPTKTPPTTPPSGATGGVWLQLRTCESGDNYAENTGNGFYGAYQFSAATWTGLGYPGRPDLEPPAMQDAAAQKLQAASGWGQWPACSAALGLT